MAHPHDIDHTRSVGHPLPHIVNSAEDIPREHVLVAEYNAAVFDDALAKAEGVMLEVLLGKIDAGPVFGTGGSPHKSPVH